LNGPLPSNGRPIVFTEPLPSSGSIRHITNDVDVREYVGLNSEGFPVFRKMLQFLFLRLKSFRITKVLIQILQLPVGERCNRNSTNRSSGAELTQIQSIEKQKLLGN
jgi:hypothetical protein